jgi:hypothetical protein
MDSFVEDFTVTLAGARMPTAKAIGTFDVASAFRGELGEVVWRGNSNRSIRMTWALELETSTNVAISTEHCDNFSPHGHSVTSRTGITDDIHAVLSSGQEDVDTVRSFEEPAFVILVTSDKADDGNLGLFSLEIIDCGDS